MWKSVECCAWQQCIISLRNLRPSIEDECMWTRFLPQCISAGSTSAGCTSTFLKGEDKGKHSDGIREDVLEAFVTRAEGPIVALSAELQALDLLSHTDPQFDPAVGMMDDHPPSMTTPSRERAPVERTSLLTSISSTAGLMLCRRTVSKNRIIH